MNLMKQFRNLNIYAW